MYVCMQKWVNTGLNVIVRCLECILFGKDNFNEQTARKLIKMSYLLFTFSYTFTKMNEYIF